MLKICNDFSTTQHFEMTRYQSPKKLLRIKIGSDRHGEHQPSLIPKIVAYTVMTARFQIGTTHHDNYTLATIRFYLGIEIPYI